MIDSSIETLIPLGRVPAEIPSRRPGKKISISTVYRWAMRECRGVRLETVLIDGGRYTSKEALQRFTELLTQISSCNETPSRGVTTMQRQRQCQSAEKKLKELGI